MFNLPHFCRICLKYDKNLIDLAHIENEPRETLMSKLEFCASEVEWSTFKPLLCHPCIKRLNISYYFKKECLQSANVLKSYLQLLKESQHKGQGKNADGETGQQSSAYMVLPNQKYLKILVGPQNQSSFQNVFLNVIPTSNSPGTPPPHPPALVPTDSPHPKNKDSNQNIFMNINNIFKKYVPIAPNEGPKNQDKQNLSVNQLLTNSKTEELSVEIDPTDYGLVDEGDSSPEETEHDWDELITHSKINSEAVSISRITKPRGGSQKKQREITKKPLKSHSKYVPILPKRGKAAGAVAAVAGDGEKMELFDAGQHFLSSGRRNEKSREYHCESCQTVFPRLIDLKSHFNQFHMGKLPYKCSYCYVEFAVRSDYELCMKFHKDQEAAKNSLTLEDFANETNEKVAEAASTTQQDTSTAAENENGEFECNVCKRLFASSTGLLRHKVRKHKQQNKKKYFIKGMKNAKCDICKREFSTQSYMQLHRKLHMRDVTGYKYKVFGKNKYANNGDESKNGKTGKRRKKDYVDVEEDNEAEAIDCTPDIICNSDGESEEEEKGIAEDEERNPLDLKDDEMSDFAEDKEIDHDIDILQNGFEVSMDVDDSSKFEDSKIIDNCDIGKDSDEIIQSEEIMIDDHDLDDENE